MRESGFTSVKYRRKHQGARVQLLTRSLEANENEPDERITMTPPNTQPIGHYNGHDYDYRIAPDGTVWYYSQARSNPGWKTLKHYTPPTNRNPTVQLWASGYRHRISVKKLIEHVYGVQS
jgi:hypothetical protein